MYNNPGNARHAPNSTGKNTIQHKCISLSNRTRGSVARTHIYVNANILALSPSTTPVPPPINNIAVNVDRNRMDAYSAKKNNTNIDDEYSVMCPLTNSDSASTLSKGGRAHSATQAMKNIIAKGSSGTPSHVASCSSMCRDKFIVFVISIANITNVVNTNS